MSEVTFPEGWNNLDIIPPNTFVEVIDAEGRTAYARPGYYPFEVKKLPGDESKPWGWRGTPVPYPDGVERWDGSWFINVGMEIDKIGTVIGWRLIKQKSL